MFTWGKRVACFAMAGTLALGGLAGCSQQQQQQQQQQEEPKIATVDELIDKWEANENKDNYHMELAMDMGASYAGTTMSVTTTGSGDVLKDASHMQIKASAMGQDMDSETYMEKGDGDKYIQYTTADGGTTWTKSEVDQANSLAALTSKEIFKDGKLEATDDGYKVTVPGSALLNAMSAMGSSDPTTMFGDSQQVKDAIDKSEVVCTFNKDCLLTGMDYKLSVDITTGLTTSTEDSSSAADSSSSDAANISLTMKTTFSDFGSVDASKVTVPADVKSNATDAPDLSALENLVSEESTTTDADAASDASSEADASSSSAADAA